MRMDWSASDDLSMIYTHKVYKGLDQYPLLMNNLMMMALNWDQWNSTQASDGPSGFTRKKRNTDERFDYYTGKGAAVKGRYWNTWGEVLEGTIKKELQGNSYVAVLHCDRTEEMDDYLSMYAINELHTYIGNAKFLACDADGVDIVNCSKPKGVESEVRLRRDRLYISSKVTPLWRKQR